MNWTEEEYAAFLQKAGKAAPKRKNKYNARRVWVDGIAFDSQKEADYYMDLKLRARAGDIDGFAHHGNMVVAEGEGATRGTLYETDFIVFLPGGRYEIIDTKGIQTDVFKNKIKVLRNRYPRIKIKTK